jgi:hypothetical protein
MIIHECLQGSAIWLSARSGIPTASCFDRIVTPTGKLSTQADAYMHQLLAERMLGRPITDVAVTSWMSRGTMLEGEAISFYESMRELDTVRVGLCTNDAGTIGASPDRLVGEGGLLEIKCPKESTHVGYLLTGSAGAAYRPQVQGQLMVTGRAWVDLLSYSPDLPHALIRIERDEDYIATLSNALDAFSEQLEAKAAELRERGWIAPGPAVPASAIVSAYDRAEPVDEAVLASAWQHYSARDKAVINAARSRRAA